MSTTEQIYNLATDIANVVPAEAYYKRQVRKQILQVAIMAIESQQADDSTVKELGSMVKYSG